MTTSLERDPATERARHFLRHRCRLAAAVTGTAGLTALASAALSARFDPSRPRAADGLAVAAVVGAAIAMDSAVWLARAGLAVLVVRANGLRRCDITEVRSVDHIYSWQTVLRIDDEVRPCSLEPARRLATGPALATRPAHWRVIVAPGDRPRLVNQPWTRSYANMWNAWLAREPVPDGPVKGGPWTRGRVRDRRRRRTTSAAPLPPRPASTTLPR